MEQLPGALGASQALSGLDQASQCTYMAMTSQCSIGEIVSTYRRTKVRRTGKKERHVDISFFKLENLLFQYLQPVLPLFMYFFQKYFIFKCCSSDSTMPGGALITPD
jgi:hypothetical protein